MISATTAVGILRRASDELGAELPAALADAVRSAAALVESAEQVGRTGGTFLGAALDVLESGGDVAADKRTLQLLVADTLVDRNLPAAARQRGDDRVRDALLGCADQILASWRECLEPHAAALREAVATGMQTLEDPVAIRGMGSAAMQHWVTASEGNRLWQVASDAVLTLGLATGTPIGRHERTLIVTPADPVIGRLQVAGVAPDAWAVAAAGLELDFIGSLDEYRGRAISLEQQQIEMAREPEPRPARV